MRVRTHASTPGPASTRLTMRGRGRLLHAAWRRGRPLDGASMMACSHASVPLVGGACRRIEESVGLYVGPSKPQRMRCIFFRVEGFKVSTQTLKPPKSPTRAQGGGRGGRRLVRALRSNGAGTAVAGTWQGKKKKTLSGVKSQKSGSVQGSDNHISRAYANYTEIIRIRRI
jgi:hypothetical protein